MSKKDIDDIMTGLEQQIQAFKENPTYDKALQLDASISILRFLIGERDFLLLHYLRQAHEDIVKLIDKHNAAHAE